jgi:hypothetical protein
MWMQPDTGNFAHQDSPSKCESWLTANVNDDDPCANSKLTPIQIDPSWAAALNVPLRDHSNNSSGRGGITTIESLLKVIVELEPAFENNTAAFLQNVAASLGMMFTDGLARVGWNEPFAVPLIKNNEMHLIYFSNNGTESQDVVYNNSISDLVELDFSFSRNGYSYSMRPTTVKLATTILLIHVVIAIAHTIIVCAPRHSEWRMGSWPCMVRLVALALTSQHNVDKLQNECTDVEMRSTWGRVVKVRETKPGQLEMSIQDEGEGLLSTYAKEK